MDWLGSETRKGLFPAERGKGPRPSGPARGDPEEDSGESIRESIAPAVPPWARGPGSGTHLSLCCGAARGWLNWHTAGENGTARRNRSRTSPGGPKLWRDACRNPNVQPSLLALCSSEVKWCHATEANRRVRTPEPPFLDHPRCACDNGTRTVNADPGDSPFVSIVETRWRRRS